MGSTKITNAAKLLESYQFPLNLRSSMHKSCFHSSKQSFFYLLNKSAISFYYFMMFFPTENKSFLISFVLFSGILCRPVALSIPYLILLFYIPFVPVATSKTIRGHTGYFFKIAIAISTIIVSLQIAFQIVLVTKGAEFLQACEFLQILFRHIGMIQLSDVA